MSPQFSFKIKFSFSITVMWRESPSAFESHREPENMNRVCVCMRINHHPSSGIKPVTFISLI